MPTVRGEDRAEPGMLALRRRDPGRVGPYVLLGRLGSGAMGQVYLGRSAGGRLVAVKTIRDEYAEDDDFRARFAQEVASASRVSGVFTAAVVDADPTAEVPWLATAYVPAPSLARMVETCGPLPPAAVRWLTAGCAEALQSIHAAGLVHRDLKPSNVLVAAEGPQVIDFGIARAAELTSLTSTRSGLGTPAYMAPEQARDARSSSAASDVFALGSTLLYAATGHPPYRGDTLVEVLLRVTTEPPDLDGLPDELVDLVGSCLRPDPEDRPTPAALVATVAPTLRFEDGDGAAALPRRAIELIETHRRPGSGTPSRATEPDSTVGSLPGPVAGWVPPAASRPTAAGPVPVASGAAGRRTWAGRGLAAMVAVVAAAGLVATGVVAGDLLGHPAAERPGAGPGQGAPPRGQGPPPPLSGAGDTPTGPPQVQFNQPSGDPDTGFVLHGRGWVPGTRVTIALSTGRLSPDRPVVDRAGTFNQVVNGRHEFFAGGLPVGPVTVVVTGADGRQARASFRVDP